ncbi:rhodanese-like domain-containing protein [Xylariaceae sp. FL0662B]|nr:rhodanese-like domain-containing protein [Xylariaceae sp. FL0662B]
MDASSPLAAMHPAPVPSWGSRSHTHLASGNLFATGTYNIREQLQRSKPDYFNLKSVRGSSPTASLAADLSQNFRIDNEASPRFPTPRRALFTSNMMGSTDNHEYVTTPPLPASSSPVPLSDAMDISPLPQREGPYASIEISSPTPLQAGEDMMMESPTAMTRHSAMCLEPPKPLHDNRKRVGLRRPSLTRTKGHSTSSVLPRLHPENQVSSFRFGPTSAAAMSPGECFQDSPPQERRPQTANSPSSPSGGLGSFRAKPQFASLTGTRDIRNGSPISTHARRPSNPFVRPRRQYRRSLSMFENPGDVVKSKTEEVGPHSTLQSVMDVEEAQEPTLPHFFPEGENDNIPRISRETFLHILDGKFNDHYSQKVVIDCRFEYEYEGGHIDGAVNYTDKDLLARHLFETPMEGKALLIFHCEYSAHRAPLMARHVRAEDRTANAEFYPRLTYPEVYILDGGYSEFFNQHRDRCYPQAYVEMGAAEHANTCERELGKLQQKRKGLNRAKTYAFGHRATMAEASPRSPERFQEQDSPGMMIGNSPILGNTRSPARRMASY